MARLHLAPALLSPLLFCRIALFGAPDPRGVAGGFGRRGVAAFGGGSAEYSTDGFIRYATCCRGVGGPKSLSVVLAAVPSGAIGEPSGEAGMDTIDSASERPVTPETAETPDMPVPSGWTPPVVARLAALELLGMPTAVEPAVPSLGSANTSLCSSTCPLPAVAFARMPV